MTSPPDQSTVQDQDDLKNTEKELSLQGLVDGSPPHQEILIDHLFTRSVRMVWKKVLTPGQVLGRSTSYLVNMIPDPGDLLLGKVLRPLTTSLGELFTSLGFEQRGK